MNMHTPWGRSQTHKKIADGIYSHSTVSHGGFELSTNRYLEFKKIFPDFKPYAGDYWFEEDCDWAFVTIAFPQFFSNQDIYNAIRMTNYKSSGLHVPDAFWASELGIECKLHSDIFKETISDKWEVGSMSCGHNIKGWAVSISRNNERKTINLKDYPTQQFYSDNELESLAF